MRAAFLVLALLLGLSTPGWAQAQAGAAAPAEVDTAAECRALGGAWILRAWQGACQAPWAREECLRLGGAWTPLVGAPTGGLCMAAVSLAATARQCTDSGGNWGPPGSAMPFCEHRPGKAAAQLRRAPDANKLCDSQSDCSQGCVYTGPDPKPGADVLGRCRADNAPGGCHWMVEAGRIAGRICMN
jgi:hypothetical protein